MRHTSKIVLAGILLAMAAAPASAQQRRRTPARPAPAPARRAVRAQVPAAGDVAVGGNIGVTNPNHANLDTGLLVSGNVEKYLTPRLSIRGQAGAAFWDLKGFTQLTGSLNPFFADGNVVYNWEHGVWHPFATGGLGMYRYGYSQFPRPGAAEVTGSKTKVGVDFGGGIEYFFAPRATIVGEGLIHRIGDVPTPGALFHTGGGSFLSLTGGVKKYF
jgi:hypothetical protein